MSNKPKMHEEAKVEALVNLPRTGEPLPVRSAAPGPRPVQAPSAIEALRFLDQVCAQVSGPRQLHAQVAEAIGLLGAELAQVTALKEALKERAEEDEPASPAP